MIKKPAGYDEAAAYTGESQQLPKGKYVCVIKQVATQTSKNGNKQFVILFDVAEGEQKDFFQKLFNADKAQNSADAKWRGVFKQNMEGKGLSWFKGIITSIERSNNFTFQWDKENNEKTLAGKKFGGIFRRRQYEAENGNRPIVTELWQIRSVAGLADAEVPEDDLLPEGTVQKPAETPSPVGDGFMNIPEGAGDEGIRIPVEDVYWEDVRQSTFLKTGQRDAASVLLVIPLESLCNPLTFTQGKDLAVKGIVEDEIDCSSQETMSKSLAALKASHGYVTVTTVDERLYGSEAVQHYELSCK